MENIKKGMTPQRTDVVEVIQKNMDAIIANYGKGCESRYKGHVSDPIDTFPFLFFTKHHPYNIVFLINFAQLPEYKGKFLEGFWCDDDFCASYDDDYDDLGFELEKKFQKNVLYLIEDLKNYIVMIDLVFETNFNKYGWTGIGEGEYDIDALRPEYYC